ncbi:MAG: hypothetical protein BWK76_02560 [Desulfobulbaceae bacterium A2]|nr:MAG: hypothetical protein BWK76_02560 [Desulfobulbaceae bacterium A2]
MPEITCRERVLEKLQEFDDRLKGAFSAMESMVGLRGDAAHLVNSIKESQEESAGIRIELQEVQTEWENMKSKVFDSLDTIEETRQDLLKQFHEVLDDIDRRFTEETEKLRQANELLRFDHSQLAKESQAHAEKAANDSFVVGDVLARAETLLATIRQELQEKLSSEFAALSQDLLSSKEGLRAAIEGRLAQVGASASKRLGEIDNSWKERADTLEKRVEEKLTLFKTEMHKNLVTHQQGIDRQITEFLAKQNQLVQNLTQQIDGFQRVAQTLVSEQQTMSRTISTHAEGLGKISEQVATIGTLQREVQDQGRRLELIVNRLKGIPLIKKFF